MIQTKYNEEKLIEYVMEYSSDLSLYKFDEYINVGMGNIYINTIPIVTNGILTCMGVGMHINGTNYFSHLSPAMYTGDFSTVLNDWEELLKKNINDIDAIYLYTQQKLCVNTLPFLIMLNNLELIDKTYHINIMVASKSGGYTNPFNTNFKVGISKDGPWGYEYDADND